MTRHRLLLIMMVWVVALTHCTPAWSVDVDGAPVIANDLKTLVELVGESEIEGAPKGSIPVERVLYTRGYSVIASLSVYAADDDSEGLRTFDWPSVAENALWLPNGALRIDGQVFKASHITVQPSPELRGVTTSLADLAPTAAAALGLPAPAAATGRALTSERAKAVLMVFLDGFGAVRLHEARATGLIPNLAKLKPPMLGLASYPPCTVVGSATILTGAPPAVNGVLTRGTRTTESEILFDVAAAAGLQVIAVEGDALAFNLRHAEIKLSGDKDGNGSTDDNVLANALAVLNDGMPDLFWVHFHGIDDAGHSYGPGSSEEEAAITGVDAAVGKILARIPDGTLVLIFADHGMHAVNEEGRLGNHGNLIERDMLVPVWVIEKSD